MEPRLWRMDPTEMGGGSQINEPGTGWGGYCVEGVLRGRSCCPSLWHEQCGRGSGLKGQ